jgi:hypothetical protein
MNAKDAVLLAAENRQSAMGVVTVAGTQLLPMQPAVAELGHLPLKDKGFRSC